LEQLRLRHNLGSQLVRPLPNGNIPTAENGSVGRIASPTAFWHRSPVGSVVEEET
jgi:hypothetical protein